MYPADFEYHAPASLEEALSLLARYGGEAKVIAGGHSLLPLMKLRLVQPAALVDVSRIAALNYIREEGDGVAIGATTTYYQIETSDVLRHRCPVLTEAVGLIGDPMVRNKGTIGGNLAHSDPGADLPPVALALGAQLTAASSQGRRTIPAAEFFTDVYTTALRPDEILTEVRVPAVTRAAYEKFPHPASRFALTGVAAVLNGAPAVALTGAAPHATRLTAVEQALRSGASPPDASALAADGWEPLSDFHASAEYRQHLARVYTLRALERARTRG